MHRRTFVLGLAGVGAAASLPTAPAAAAAALATAPAAGARTSAAPALLPVGAVGDGVADDTQALQDLLDASAASGAAAVVPAGTYRCTRSLLLSSGTALHLEGGAHLLKDWAARPGLVNAFLRNVDFGTRSDRVSITGPGTIGAVDHSRTGVVLALYGDDVRLRDFTIDTYAGGQAILFAGDRGRIDAVTIRGSAPAFGTGGIRMFGGEDFVATGCHVESGDDCLQFVPIGDPTAVLHDLSIRRGSYVACTGASSASRFMVASLEWTSGEGGMTSSVTDCSFVACHGSGADRGIVVKNTHSSGAIERVSFVDCSVDMAGASDADTQEIRIQTGATSTGAIRDVSFTRTSITRPVNATLRIGGPNISGVTFDGCTFTAPSGAGATIAVVDAADRVTFRRCTVAAAPGKRPLTVGPVTQVTDLLVDGCRFTEIPDGVWGINLVAVDGARIVGTSFAAAAGSTTARAVRITAASRRVVLVDDDLTGLTNRTPVTDAAPDTVLRGNVGASTEAAGTATIPPGATSVTVPHGLAGSGRVPGPSHVGVMPVSGSAATSGWFVTAITATSFRIAVPTPLGQPAELAWRVDLTRR
ncbi:glycosyl hydrolase family 28-related protein [Cellulomonas aerilata]|uniref:Rhamnogalacturonase A/B/Epimerase-like pectate lyase domain-containing protein n=1 Tax=Cellulomonas aerilata TaxID=515326 RepID=A0A512DD99_9CELL|nr:glycosyl hydrolase family 28-related protein [Cellulomonas aerilata]GEO34190.1 hypothetical protein CAE01nite_19150 [Cellulomonas aerilata]